MFDDLRRNFLMNPTCGLKIRPFARAHVSRATDRELGAPRNGGWGGGGGERGGRASETAGRGFACLPASSSAGKLKAVRSRLTPSCCAPRPPRPPARPPPERLTQYLKAIARLPSFKGLNHDRWEEFLGWGGGHKKHRSAGPS